MARLSSEHHPEGPGDAPRRRKGRKSQPPSAELAKHSKRAASPDGEPSVQVKKAKHVLINDGQHQMSHELEESASRSQDGDTIHVAIEETTRRVRRQSEPVTTAQDELDRATQSTPPATQPLPGLTPHLSRLGVPLGRPSNERRARQSMPAQLHLEAAEEQDDGEIQFAPLSSVLDGRTKRRLRRNHLSEEVNDFEEHKKEDHKLKQAYLEVSRQLKEKESAIQELQFELEAKRMGDIDFSDDRVQELEEKLEQARQDKEDLRNSQTYMPDVPEDDDDAFDGEVEYPSLMNADAEDGDAFEDMMDFQSSAKTAYTSQVTVESLSSIHETAYDSLFEPSQSNPMAVPDKISDRAIMRYEKEIERLNQELANSQGTLRIVAVELQNLHVTTPGASSDEIITKMRHAFETIREELEKRFPGSTVGTTNSELLHKIPELFTAVLTRYEKTKVTSTKYLQQAGKLQTQYETVLELLATTEDKSDLLSRRVGDLEKEKDVHQQQILDLNERVSILDNLRVNQEEQINDKDAEIYGLKDQIDEKDTAIERFRASATSYREETEQLTRTVQTLEEDHKSIIADMEQAHAGVVEDLEAQLTTETEARTVAENDATQKSEYIDELEGRIEGLESEVVAITENVTALKERLATETENREAVEGERDEQVAIVYEHANTIENLNETIADLQNEIETFRQNLETERTQRERTEVDLEEANEQIAELDSNIHNAGIQANELRSKLFQVQQEKEATIATLKEEAKGREQELQELLDTETQQHQEAEADIDVLQQRQNELESDVEVAMGKLADMTKSRDQLEQTRGEQVAALTTQLSELSQKYAALENNSNSSITTLHAQITDLNNEVAAYKTEISRLETVVEETQESARIESETKDAHIEELQGELETSRDENEKLSNENQSLANRVENEAQELLNIMGSHGEESTALRKTISIQQATIDNLKATAEHTALEHVQQLEQMSSEIEEMHVMGDTRAAAIAALQGQMDMMKERFQAQEEDTRNILDTMMTSQRQLQEQNEHLAAALKKRNAEALQAVQEMKVTGIEVKTKGMTEHKVANGRVTKVSEKLKIGKKKGAVKKTSKRQWDSGFGFDENVEADMDDVAEDEGVVG